MNNKYLILIILIIIAIALLVTNIFIYHRTVTQSTSFKIPEGYTVKHVNSSVEFTKGKNSIKLNPYDPENSGTVEGALNSFKNSYPNLDLEISEIEINGKIVKKTIVSLNDSNYTNTRYWFASGNKVFNIETNYDNQDKEQTIKKIIDSAITMPI